MSNYRTVDKKLACDEVAKELEQQGRIIIS